MTVSDLLGARLQASGPIDDEDVLALVALSKGTFNVPAGTTIARRGDPMETALVLVQGLVCRSKHRRAGARQILAIHVPGDLLDATPAFERRDDALEALSACRGLQIPTAALARTAAERPSLAAALARMAAVEANIAAERLVSLGRRAAIERLAHFFCELVFRMDAIGLGVRGRYDLALTQAELGDALGLSVVHVNRTLQQLRGTGAISFRSQRLVVHNLERLCQIAEFSADYLHLTAEQPGRRESAIA